MFTNMRKNSRGFPVINYNNLGIIFSWILHCSNFNWFFMTVIRTINSAYIKVMFFKKINLFDKIDKLYLELQECLWFW